ncbi:RluA family pseudouridine synthase [Luteimonas sp. SJ-16]|uniref:Dual-specificity RNA pseudouridine synthase RluA n=2 Tax=Luteimonas deserti TaxID=2752306 RepID=A0A7Z0QNV5_9GAMM|nr:RluA family pseudouridine synthase [Luteimonas deserti]NYZ61157.1 RluA family pseudouridine synthase [Luteimonas deserti]
MHPEVEPEGLRILFADACLLAFDKPAGLLSVPGRGADKYDSLATRAVARWSDARVVHRLDMATSGVIVFARGAEAQRALGAAFAAREVQKHYVAVVTGSLARNAGQIDLPLAADWPNRPRQRVDAERGKSALTRWHVIRYETGPDGERCTRVALTPVTGRSHQLRVHLKAIGHPILGDPLYGTAADTGADGAPRLMLHATALSLAHPGDGRPLTMHSPVPF